MLEILDKIKEKQAEAEKIIDDAYIEVEKINSGLLDKSVTANEEAFLAEIDQIEKKADELRKSSTQDIEVKIKQILNDAEQQAQEIERKAKVNHEKAVNYVLDMIFNKGEKK